MADDNNEPEYSSSDNPFDNSSFLKEQEKSQKGDLMSDPNSEIFEDIQGISEEIQNSNNKDLNNDSFSRNNLVEARQEQENVNDFLKNKDQIVNILTYSIIILIINKGNLINFEKISYNNGNNEISYENFKKWQDQQYFELEENNILFTNYKKLIEYLEKIKEIANNIFSGIIIEKELKIQIELKEDNNNSTDENIKIINSEYTYDKVKGNDNDKHKFQDKNILMNCNYEGFNKFSQKIKEYLTPRQESINNISSMWTSDIEQIKKKYFISFRKVIGKHKGIAQKIMKLDDGSYVSGGKNKIIKYSKDFKEIDRHDFNNIYTFFTEENKVIISLQNKFTSFNEESISNVKGIYPCRNLFKFKNKNYLICSENGIYYASDIFSPILSDNYISKQCILPEKTYIGGIKITDDIIAITSNSYIPKGENKLVFFNTNSKNISKENEFENYSFTTSENNCSIMKIPKYENSKLLLVACTKYLESDKNGILLIKLQFLEEGIKTYQKFYDTQNFEVYCFCPILKIESKKVLENMDNAKKIETGYFLVGGFDTDKREGLIKLFKVIYCDEIKNIEIKYIQDITIEEKEGKRNLQSSISFKGPISCIIHSPERGVLVTCHDGKVCLLSDPDLSIIEAHSS